MVPLLPNRLNRTSVGLKPSPHAPPEPTPRCLNRTSVGLKRSGRYDYRIVELSLNRTSVGLKRVEVDVLANKWGASIEPAWD